MFFWLEQALLPLQRSKSHEIILCFREFFNCYLDDAKKLKYGFLQGKFFEQILKKVECMTTSITDKKNAERKADEGIGKGEKASV